MSKSSGGMKNALIGLISGLIKPGFLITIVVYITIMLFNNSGGGMLLSIIASLLGVITFAGWSWYSSSTASNHMTTEIAERDILGDLFVVLVQFGWLLWWFFLPQMTTKQVTGGIYFVVFFFLFAMTIIAIFEMVLSLRNSLNQLYRLTPIAYERGSAPPPPPTPPHH
jgi:hypothetical protein